MKKLWKVLVAANIVLLLTVVPILSAGASEAVETTEQPIVAESVVSQVQEETSADEQQLEHRAEVVAQEETEASVSPVADVSSEQPQAEPPVEEEEPVSSSSAPDAETDATPAATVAGLTIKALEESADVGTQALYEVTFQYFATSAGPQSGIEMVLTLPEQINGVEVSFVQPLEQLALHGVVPVYDEAAHTLTYAFGELQQSFQEKVLLEIETQNGANVKGMSLVVSGTLSTDAEKREASVTLNAAPNASLTNKMTQIIRREDDDPDDRIPASVLSPHPGDKAVFSVGVSVNRFDSGSLATQADGFVTVTYTLPAGFTYLEDTQSDYFKSYENQVVTWEFPANMGADSIYYFIANIDITTQVEETVQVYKTLSAVAKASIPFANGATGTVQRTATMVVVFDKNNDGDLNTGTSYSSAIYSPSLSKEGSETSPTANDNPTVLPGSMLTWKLALNTMGMTTPNYNNNSYDFYVHMDEHLSLDSFYTGDFYFKPSTGYPGWQPYTDPFYISISVKYTDSTQWEPLMENIAPSTTYTAAQMGVDPSRTIQSLWFHAHDGSGQYTFLQHPSEQETIMTIPPGLYSYGTRLFTLVDEDYVGEIGCSADVSYCGWDAEGYRLSQYSNPEYIGFLVYNQINDQYMSYFNRKTAQVANDATGTTRYIRAEIGVGKSSGSILQEGAYDVQVNVTNDESSLRAFPGPFTGYVVLPSGVNYTGEGNANYTVDVVTTNFQNAGKTLLKITWHHTSIGINSTIKATLPVEITSAASYKLNFEYYGTIDEAYEYEVAEVLGTVYNTYTIKVTDEQDINGDGNTAEQMYYTNNEYMKTNAYGYYAIAGVKSADDTAFAQVTQTDSVAQMQVSIKNEKKSAVSNLTLVYSLPGVGDNYLLEDMARESAFSAHLTGPLVLPAELAPKFDVVYSSLLNPDAESDLQVNVAARAAATDTLWITAADVTDWAAMRSFKLVMKDNVAPITTDIVFDFPVTIDAATLPTQRTAPIAHATYAVAINDLMPMESAKVSIMYQPKPVEPSVPGTPETPEPPAPPVTEQPNTGATANTTTPKTADSNTQLVIGFVLAAVSLVLILSVVVYIKKQKARE